MLNIDIPNSLYEDFQKEKNNLDSTLSTIEILKDEKLIGEIKKGLIEIKEGNSEKLDFDQIDDL